MSDTLLAFGGAVKALGEGKVGGYLVRFGSETEKDLVGDWFTKDTYFGARNGDGADALFHHGIPLGESDYFKSLADTLLPPIKTKVDDLGVWAETVLDMADEYQKQIYNLVEAGKLAWSSGAAPHMVKRKDNVKYGEIKRWPIIEGSLTPTPCEPRNTSVLPLKSFIQATTLNAKGVFEDKLAEMFPTTYELFDVLSSIISDIKFASWDRTITEEEATTKLNEALKEFSARIKEAVLKQFATKSVDVEYSPFLQITKALDHFNREVKAGRRNASKDLQLINAIHRTCIDLGCTECAGVADVKAADTEKSVSGPSQDPLQHSWLMLQELELATIS